jgi:hypothetical protein
MIFSGDNSKDLWKVINKVAKKKSKKKLARAACKAIYLLGCKCQELETEVERLKENKFKGD